MTRDEARAIELDCAQVLTRFFNLFDQWRYDDMVALFAPDGVWHRQGKALRGPEAILAVLHARSPTQSVRHVVTNLEVEALGPDRARSLLYVTAYQHDTGVRPVVVPVIRGPSLLLSVPGELVRVDGAWRIASLTMTREFVFA